MQNGSTNIVVRENLAQPTCFVSELFFRLVNVSNPKLVECSEYIAKSEKYLTN